MKTFQKVVQFTGDFPSCQKPPDSQDIFDWNNFDDYSVGSSSQGYFSPGYQERGSTGSEMSFNLNQGQVSSQGMTPTFNESSQIMMYENPKNNDTQKSNRGKSFLYKIVFFFIFGTKQIFI